MASSSTLSSLPLELLEEILLRSSAESLVRAKPTCKKWRDLINEERFIYKHLDRSPVRTDERRFLRISETVQIMDLVTRRLSVSPIPEEFQLASLSKIVSLFHCDGLMLCILSDKESQLPILALWNPLTSKFKRIEHSLPPFSAIFDEFGIGYHIINTPPRRDYKILRFSAGQFGVPVVEMYECNSNSWRTLVDAEVEWDVYPRCRGVSVMGNMYWLVRKDQFKNRYYVLCFDFSVETFKEICFFHFPCDRKFLGCFEGDRLSLVQQNEEPLSPIEVWVSSKLADGNVSFRRYFRVDSPDLPAICFFPYMDNPVYCIAKNKTGIMTWCAEQVYEGGRVSTCITLYEINYEGGVSYRRVTERRYRDSYDRGTFLCGYVYVPSLIPLPV